MKKILFLFMLAFLLFNCQKEKTETLIQLEKQFYGTICVDPTDYEGSAYENQPDQLKADMPAIFQVKVFKNNMAASDPVFKNADWYGAGAPLEVKYYDNPDIQGEVFSFEIWVWVKAVNGFTYQHYHTFSVTDDQWIDTGIDEVVDFAIGACTPGADYEWSWLEKPSGGILNLIIYP